jgi:hypothetical protein
LQALSNAENELCAATTIAIYHHWERFVPAKNGKLNRNHDELKDDLGHAGVTLHTEIDALQFSANYLKHGTPQWLDRLVENFGDKFPNLVGRKLHRELTWVRQIQLNAEHIDWFFLMAKESSRQVMPSE